jgi:plasmid stability protein
MKNVQIRGVPERTHAVMKRRAARAGMSMQEYLLALIKEQAEQPTVEEVLARASDRTRGRFALAQTAKDVRDDRARR